MLLINFMDVLKLINGNCWYISWPRVIWITCYKAAHPTLCCTRYILLLLKRVNCVNHEIRPNRPNGPVGESKTSTSTCPTKVGPILSHGPPAGTKAQTCPSRFKKLVLQAGEACSASLRGLFSRSGWLPQQVCEACSTRKGGKTSLL